MKLSVEKYHQTVDYKIRLCRVPLREFYGVTIKPTLRQLLWVSYRALSKTFGWYFQLSVWSRFVILEWGPWDKEPPLSSVSLLSCDSLLEDPDTVWPGNVICVKLAMGSQDTRCQLTSSTARHPPSPAAPPPTNFLTCPQSWLDTESFRVNKWSFVLPNRPEALHSPVTVIQHSAAPCTEPAAGGGRGGGRGCGFNPTIQRWLVDRLSSSWPGLEQSSSALLRRRGSVPLSHMNVSGAALGANPAGRWDCSRAQGRASSLTCIWAAWLVSPQAFRHQLFLTQKPLRRSV